MNKLNAFVKEFKAIIVGDDAEALGFKNWRKAESGLKVQIAALNGDIIAKEDALENAQENLMKARVNYGKEISDRDAYIANLIKAKESLKQAEKQLIAHKETVDFLEEQYALLKAE